MFLEVTEFLSVEKLTSFSVITFRERIFLSVLVYPQGENTHSCLMC